MLKHCMDCYPRICRCPQPIDDKIGALRISLRESCWNVQEKTNMHQELSELEGSDRKVRIARLEKFIEERNNFCSDEKASFIKEVEALKAGKDLKEIEKTFWWGKKTLPMPSL